MIYVYIIMYHTNYMQFYKDEKYQLCHSVIKRFEFSYVIEEYFLSGERLDDTAKECFYKNNNVVCSALMLDNEILNCRESWGDIMHQFIQLHVSYKGLPVIPISLRINYAYNALWWYWTKPTYFSCEDTYFHPLMALTSQILVVVLNTFKETYSAHFREITMTDVLNLMKRSSNYLLKLNCLESIQLLDMYIILLQIIIKKGDDEIINKCLIFFEKIIQQIQVLRLHLASDDLSGSKDTGLFKFGLEHVNSMATTSKYEQSLVALLITGSLANLNQENYDTALNYLLIAEKMGNVSSFKYILKYLKAYCHLYLEQAIETELLLASIISEPMGPQRKSYYHQLLGSLFSHRGQHKQAILHFEKAVETGYNISAALLLAANEAEELHFSSARCVFLKNLVDALKAGNENKKISTFQLRSFQERCLSALHPDPVVTLPEALYLLAREALISQHYFASAEHYADLLTALKKDVFIEVLTDRPAPLPKTPIIYHEAALANLKGHNLLEAHNLCQSVISNHMPRCTRFTEAVGYKRKRQIEISDKEHDLEGVLAMMEEDVVALILDSDILVSQKENKKAVDSLDRCYNVILEYQKYKIPEKKPRLEMPDQPSNANLLCDCLLAKVFLRKAKISETNNFIDSVYHFYRRALQFSPGDEEVLYNYKMWSQENKGKESFDLPKKKEVLSIEEVQSCALKYILGSNLQTEPETDVVMNECIIEEDIVDSLFDDY